MLTSVASEIERSSSAFAALGDPTRLAILELLRRRDQCVCHLVVALDLKQSLVSHHIGVLRRARLISSYPHPSDRRWLYYRLNRGAFTDLGLRLGWLNDATDYDPTPEPCPIDLAPEDA